MAIAKLIKTQWPFQLNKNTVLHTCKEQKILRLLLLIGLLCNNFRPSKKGSPYN